MFLPVCLCVFMFFCVCVGHRDARTQRSEPDAVCERDRAWGRGSLHQDPHRRRLHPALGPQDSLVPVRDRTTSTWPPGDLYMTSWPFTSHHVCQSRRRLRGWSRWACGHPAVRTCSLDFTSLRLLLNWLVLIGSDQYQSGMIDYFHPAFDAVVAWGRDTASVASALGGKSF